jgi:hypothetical protein
VAARHDDPNGVHGTLVGDAAGAGRTPTAPHSVSVLEPRPPPGTALAAGRPPHGEVDQTVPEAHIIHPIDCDEVRKAIRGVAD